MRQKKYWRNSAKSAESLHNIGDFNENSKEAFFHGNTVVTKQRSVCALRLESAF